MKKLFLTSVAANMMTKIVPMLDNPVKELKVAFIPTAGDPYGDNKPWMDADRQKLVDLGFDVFDFDLKSKKQDEVNATLTKADIIFVAGGNTFYLLEKARKSGFDKVCQKLIDEGKIYIGSSAGSYLVCPTIEAAAWKHSDKNIVNLTDLTALNLVPFIITAHFNEDVRQAVVDGAATTNLPVVALNDKQAIIVEGEKISLIGDGPKEFFNGFEEKND
jgi:dipeptidase E